MQSVMQHNCRLLASSQDFHHICTFSEFSFKCFSLNLRMDGWEPRFPHTCLQFYTFHHNNYTCVSKSPFLILPYSHFSLTYYAVCYVCSSVCRTATFIPFFKVTLWLAAFFFSVFTFLFLDSLLHCSSWGLHRLVFLHKDHKSLSSASSAATPPGYFCKWKCTWITLQTV